MGERGEKKHRRLIVLLYKGMCVSVYNNIINFMYYIIIHSMFRLECEHRKYYLAGGIAESEITKMRIFKTFFDFRLRSYRILRLAD